jgi:hypothetical protein
MRKMTDLEALVNKLDSGLDQHSEKLDLNRESTPADRTEE